MTSSMSGMSGDMKGLGQHIGTMNINMAEMNQSMGRMSHDMAVMNQSMGLMRGDINKFTRPESIMMPFMPDMR